LKRALALIVLATSLTPTNAVLGRAIEIGAVRVIDGDTLSTTLDGRRERIRISAIDAPETGKRARCRAERQRGAEARSWLERRLAGARVTVELHGRDRYGRLLAKVYADGRSVGPEMVQAGQAVVYARGKGARWCSGRP
jgi:micrococcal nuclease